MLAGFPHAHAMLRRFFPTSITLGQVWEQALRVGKDLVRRRNQEVFAMDTGGEVKGPPNAPDLLVAAVDGGRYQDRRRPPGDRWCEYKAAVLYRSTREEAARTGMRPDPQRAPHWRYRASDDGFEREEGEEDKKYEDPRPEVKTFVATTEDVERFPRYVELEARRRGIMTAKTVAFVGDGGDLVWRTAREVGEARRLRGLETFEILDIIHAGEHLAEAARARFGATEEGAAWLNARLGELWRGDAEGLVLELEARAEDLAPKPGPEKSRARVVWNARNYFDDHRERIRYDDFRRHGLPQTSAHIESAIKQANHRVKGSEKQWYKENAEAMLALRTLALSEDGRWARHFEALKRGETVVPKMAKLRRLIAQAVPLPKQQKKAG
jgi:hypothetical protein